MEIETPLILTGAILHRLMAALGAYFLTGAAGWPFTNFSHENHRWRS